MTFSLLASILLTLGGTVPAGADPGPPGQANVAALNAKVQADAVRIHHLTEQLDEARLAVGVTSARLQNVNRQHDATVQSLASNRAVLVQQAQQAYMQGGLSMEMQSMGSADLTLNQEYLQMAAGNVYDTGDQLRQLERQLHVQEASLQLAQQANTQASLDLQTLRTSALSVAASDQAQLEGLQVQLLAQQRTAGATSGRATQGLPVNGGLVHVVQQAAGIPIATPLATAPVAASSGTSTAPSTSASIGGNSSTGTTSSGAGSNGSGGAGGAGGVWLQLRLCESGGNYGENTGNGFFGAYQFSQSTWTDLGFPGRPDQEPPGMQDQAAMKDQAVSGWGQWPACSAALGLL